MEERFLNNSRIWLAFECERLEKLFLEVWEALPAGERDFLKDKISKVSDQFDPTYNQLRIPKSKRTRVTGTYFHTPSEIVINPALAAELPEFFIRYVCAHELGHAFSYLSALSLIDEIEKNRGPMESGERNRMLTLSQRESIADMFAKEWGFPRFPKTLLHNKKDLRKQG